MKKQSLLLILFSLLFFLGCKKKDQITSNDKDGFYQPMSSIVDSFFIDLETASNIAKKINNNGFLDEVQLDPTLSRTFDSVYAIPDKFGNAALYVFNYSNDNGFIIVSADLRYMPITSFVEKGSLLKSSSIPSGLGGWLEVTTSKIEYIREYFEEYNEEAKASVKKWIYYFERLGFQIPFLPASSAGLFDEGAGIPCVLPPVTIVKQALLTT